MDADLKPLELEIVFLERLSGTANAHAFMTVMLRDVEVLSALKLRFPRRALTLEGVRDAAGHCRDHRLPIES